MIVLGFTSEQWFEMGISVVILLIAAVAGRWILTLILDRAIRGVAERTQTTLDDSILRVIRGPLYWLIMTLALRMALIRIDFIPERWQRIFPDVFFVLYLLMAILLVCRLAEVLADWYSRELGARAGSQIEKRWMPFARRLAFIVILVIALTMLLSRFDVDISGMIATLGIGSLAIALAAQASLSDMISGFIIMIDQPYRVGDRIEIMDLDAWGDVVDVGLRSTRIRTRDNRMVIVPNSVIAKSLVVNYSYPDTQYRIQIHVGMAYGTEIEKARQALIEAVRRVKGVLQTRPVEALFLEFGESALIFRVRWWIESFVDTRRMFDRVNGSIYNALIEAGIELPPPQRELHHRIDEKDAYKLMRAIHEARKSPLAGQEGQTT